MLNYRYVFVVLVYRNTDVLKGFFESVRQKVSDYKVILVNSFYDEQSLDECRQYAETYHADFIPIENRGYGYGNNVGIEYVLGNYYFDYLIISNSDIILENIDNLPDSKDALVIAPDTTLLNGKKQNPNIVCRSKSFLTLLKLAYRKNNMLFWDGSHVISRLTRELFRFYKMFVIKKQYRIFGCHGSFFIVTYKASKLLHPLFNDRMFLYNEELYLAFNAESKNIPIYYIPSVKVTHLEGASTDAGVTDKAKCFERNKQSFEELCKVYKF